MKNIISLKRLLCLGVAVAGFASAPAFADPAGNWAGPYVGGFVGENWSDFGRQHSTNGPFGNDSSMMYGGDLGNNWQFDHMIVGLEGDFSKFNTSDGSNGVKFTEDWSTSLRARMGYGFNRFMPYVTGGLAMTDTVAKISRVGSDEEVQPGYVIGGGVDALMTGNWFGRVEYLHTDVPRDSVGGTGVSGGSGNDAVRLGVNYKF